MKFQPTTIGWLIIAYVALSILATFIIFIIGGDWEFLPTICIGIAGQIITLLVVIEAFILLARFIKKKLFGKKEAKR